MYKKLCIRLTFFCTLVITVILTGMTAVCLKLVRDNNEANRFNNFQRLMNNICQTLEEQDAISHSWLTNISVGNGILLSVLDNSVPLLYTRENISEEEEILFAQARETAAAAYSLSEQSVQRSGYARHVEFRINTPVSGAGFASVLYIPKAAGILTVTALSPAIDQKGFIQTLCLPILALMLGAAAALSLGSWVLIRHMVRPLIRSHERQIQFFTAASHELRSPLAVILSAISAMKEQLKDAEHYLPIAEKEGLRMRRLINDMFTLACLDNGRLAIHSEKTALENLVIEAYEKFSALAGQKGIQLKVRLPEEILPECFCDRERIAQALQILLDNAVSYTPENGRIDLELSGGRGRFWLTVADNGPGIPDAEKKEVFSRFYRGDQARTDKQHFGLGLSIAKEIVVLHRGTIRLEDSPGGGAKFVITIP